MQLQPIFHNFTNDGTYYAKYYQLTGLDTVQNYKAWYEKESWVSVETVQAYCVYSRNIVIFRIYIFFAYGFCWS